MSLLSNNFVELRINGPSTNRPSEFMRPNLLLAGSSVKSFIDINSRIAASTSPLKQNHYHGQFIITLVSFFSSSSEIRLSHKVAGKR